MDTVLIVIGIILIIIGIIGSILPALPGAPLVYAALIILQFTDKHPFSILFLSVWGVITALTSLLDYFIPIWGTKKFGGSRKGVIGSTAGLVAGIIILPALGIVLGPFGLIGIILGPFIGAVIGELIEGRDINAALYSGLGSFLGFAAGTIMKLSVCFIMAFYYFKSLF
jgi:uncharacterized protein YqgC (DUF456 family)